MTPDLKRDIAGLLGVPEEQVLVFGMQVPPERHFALAQLLKTHGYLMYVTVVASHWPTEPPSKQLPKGRSEYFEVDTVLRKLGLGSSTFSWRVQLEPGKPIDTLYPLFAGADWQEREQYDLVGVRFGGHPDLRRIMMPEDWVGHPLRRDYPIETAHTPWR